MTQSSSQESLADKLHHIADIIASTKEECIRCGRELHYMSIINHLLQEGEKRLIDIKGLEGFLCCDCYSELSGDKTTRIVTNVNSTDIAQEMLSNSSSSEISYAYGLSGFTGLSPEQIVNSVPFGRYGEWLRDFKRNKAKYYRRSIEEKQRKISKYKHLIEKHEINIGNTKTTKEINRRRRMIDTYTNHIKKLKNSIRWLEFLVEMENKGKD